MRKKEEEKENTKFWKKHERLKKRAEMFDPVNVIERDLKERSKREREERKREVEMAKNRVEEKVEKININVDFDRNYYKRKELNEHEIKYLLSEGYEEYSHRSIITNKNERYILRARFNESLKHLFFVYNIKEYLQTQGISAEIFMTRMPDLVFNFYGRKIAIEVETGTVLTNMKKFREKIKLLNEKYGKNWFFVVTNRNLLKKYKKYGKVIDPRFIKFNLNKIINNR